MRNSKDKDCKESVKKLIISLPVSLSYGLLTKYSDLLFKIGLTRYCDLLPSLDVFFDDVFSAKRKAFSAKVRHVIVDVVTFLF